MARTFTLTAIAIACVIVGVIGIMTKNIECRTVATLLVAVLAVAGQIIITNKQQQSK